MHYYLLLRSYFIAFFLGIIVDGRYTIIRIRARKIALLVPTLKTTLSRRKPREYATRQHRYRYTMVLEIIGFFNSNIHTYTGCRFVGF